MRGKQEEERTVDAELSGQQRSLLSQEWVRSGLRCTQCSHSVSRPDSGRSCLSPSSLVKWPSDAGARPATNRSRASDVLQEARDLTAAALHPWPLAHATLAQSLPGHTSFPFPVAGCLAPGTAWLTPSLCSLCSLSLLACMLFLMVLPQSRCMMEPYILRPPSPYPTTESG